MDLINLFKNKEFEEGVDYYLIEGRVLFTEKYLKERGECCGNDCEFCCYTEKFKGNKDLKK